MFNDEGLGAAMAQHAVEQKGKDLEKRIERLEQRQILLYQILAECAAPDQLRYLSNEWNRLLASS